MQLHVFEQDVFNRHQNILYFMCFFLTWTAVSWVAGVQHQMFFNKCHFSDNSSYFDDVLNRAVVPPDAACRFYTDDANSTTVNASELYVVSNLTTVLQQCTLSFVSVWR